MMMQFFESPNGSIVMEATNVQSGRGALTPQKTVQLNVGPNFDLAFAVLMFHGTQLLLSSW
jgi:hypothetical protein